MGMVNLDQIWSDAFFLSWHDTACFPPMSHTCSHPKTWRLQSGPTVPEPCRDWYSSCHHHHLTVAFTDISWSNVLKCAQTPPTGAGREERCFLVEQHCHLMVAEHPYKVCSDAPTPALKVVSPKCSWIEMQRHPSKSASPTPAPSLGPGGFLSGLVSRWHFQMPTSSPTPTPQLSPCQPLHSLLWVLLLILIFSSFANNFPRGTISNALLNSR